MMTSFITTTHIWAQLAHIVTICNTTAALQATCTYKNFSACTCACISFNVNDVTHGLVHLVQVLIVLLH